MTHLQMTAFAILASLATSGASGEPIEQSDREGRIAQIGSYSARLRMAAAADPDKPFEFRKQPVLYWTNPTRSDAFGGLYLWTRVSRPMALAGVFVRVYETETRLTQEFHSLTDLPLNVEFDGKQVWAPTVAGVTFRAAPAAKAPVESAPARLRQMKNIAGQFSITVSWPEVAPDKLRALSKPIYRYSDPKTGLIDGAIIAFAQGTDPEALLLVEASSSSGTLGWYYAIVRCTSWAIRARLNEKIVYDVPVARRDENDASAAYFRVRRTLAE